MDFAGGTIDDLRRCPQIDPHRQHGTFADNHTFGNFGTRADEGTVADDHRPGLHRFENTADADAARQMDIFADLGASTKIIDRATGEIHIGKVPPYAVVVSGTLLGKPLPDGSPGPGLYCGVIVKTVDAQTRSKTGINELLRD